MSSVVTQLAGAKTGVDQLNNSGIKVPGIQDLFPNAVAGASGIVNPATVDQANQLYGQQQNAIGQQQDFVNALQGAYAGLPQQQMALNQQLQGVANGTGPNPALAQLQQTTGQNVANQAALMAGQRGSSSNPGMMARQIAQQGANTQQQAVGQGATLAAQQQLAAMGQLGQQQQNMLGMQQGAMNANQAGITGAQGHILNSIGGQNNANVNYAGITSGVDMANAKKNNQLASNVMSGIGSALGMFAEGGEAQGFMNSLGAGMDDAITFADKKKKKAAPEKQEKKTEETKAPVAMAGGPMDATGIIPPAADTINTMGPQSRIGQFLAAAKGGKVPALLSPGEKYLSPKQVEKGANPMKDGKTVPGKPKVSGAKDSYANDTVPATLEEGGIVIPRSITQGKDAEKRSMEFVRAIMAKKR